MNVSAVNVAVVNAPAVNSSRADVPVMEVSVMHLPLMRLPVLGDVSVAPRLARTPVLDGGRGHRTRHDRGNRPVSTAGTVPVPTSTYGGEGGFHALA